MSEYNMPMFMISCCARDEGASHNIGNMEYLGGMPVEFLHSGLVNNKPSGFGVIENVYPNSKLQYNELTNLFPIITKSTGLRGENILNETYTFAFFDVKTNKIVPIYVPIANRTLTELVLDTNKFSKPGDIAEIDFIYNRVVKDIDGNTKKVKTHYKIAFGIFMAKEEEPGSNNYKISDEEAKKLKNTAKIKNNNLLEKCEERYK